MILPANILLLSRFRHGYFQFLPKREFLPLFWPPPLQRAALHTRLDPSKAAADLAALQDDFQEVVAPMLTRHPEVFKHSVAGMTFPAMLVASSWVSSRAFHVDDLHGGRSPPSCSARLRCTHVALHGAALWHRSAGTSLAHMSVWSCSEHSMACRASDGASGGRLQP